MPHSATWRNAAASGGARCVDKAATGDVPPEPLPATSAAASAPPGDGGWEGWRWAATSAASDRPSMNFIA